MIVGLDKSILSNNSNTIPHSVFDCNVKREPTVLYRRTCMR